MSRSSSSQHEFDRVFLVLAVVFFILANTSTYAQECGQSYSGSSVNFTSPGWPSPYAINLDCMWTIASHPQTYIKLVITDLDLQTEGCNDYLLIRRPNEDVVVGCDGNITAPVVFYSSGNYTTVTFVSDGVTSRKSRGFRAEVHVLQVMCPPSHLSGLSGDFTSPNFPDSYPFNIKCTYNITVPQGYRVELEFPVLFIEHSVNCTADYIYTRIVRRWFKYCGKFKPPAPHVVSNGPNMVVLFVSNKNKTYQGFKAHYKAVPLNIVSPPPENPDYLASSFVPVINHSITGHTIKKLLASSNIACVMLCQRTSKCKSATFMAISQSSGHCILHDTAGTPDSLEQRNDVVFYRLV